MTIVLCDGDSVNSYGFRTVVSGIDLKRFTANPVMLYQHDPERLLGHWENVRIDGNKLVADPVFDTEDEEVQKIVGKIDRGHLKGCSVGMMVHKFDNSTGEMYATESELMEASIVTIPSDANALILYNPEDERQALTVEEFTKLYINMENTEQKVITDNSEVVANLQASLDAKEQTITELKAQIAQMEATNINTMLNTAVKDGRINKDQFQDWATLAAKDFAAVENILNSMQPKAEQSLAAMVHRTDNGDKRTYMDWMKNDPQGLQAMRQNDPEQFKMLYDEQFK